MKKNGLFGLFLSAVIIAVFFSCAAIEESTKDGFGKKTAPPRYTGVKNYTAIGEDESLIGAFNKAKISAVRQGVTDIIGSHSEQANYNLLKENLYDTENPNKYIVNADVKVLQKTKNGFLYVYKAEVPVKMRELAVLLNEMGLPALEAGGRGENSTIDDLAFGKGAIDPNSPQVMQRPKDADRILSDAKASAEKKRDMDFLDDYIENMTYMVFDAEESRAERFLLKSAVETANGYLLKQGYRAVDAKEVEKLKKDSSLIYEESSNENLSVIQFIAQKLNADVYIEIDAVTEGGYDLNGYYGSAKVTLKIFNPSTGELLGSVPYSSPKTFSRTSSYDAQANAIQSTVYKALPIAIDQAKILLAKAYAKGVRYEITVNDTPDSKSMARFRKELKDRLNGIKTMHQSSAQTKYAVLFFGTIDDLEALVYEAAAATAGFENMELTLLRGKALVFKSGF